MCSNSELRSRYRYYESYIAVMGSSVIRNLTLNRTLNCVTIGLCYSFSGIELYDEEILMH